MKLNWKKKAKAPEEKHPKELIWLFLIEMWERFSFYLMLGLLTLFMIDDELGGMALSTEEAAIIFGTYISLVYFTPFIGGIIADRILGYRKSVILGASLMCAGHVALAFDGDGFFYLGLSLLILGNGFFKPNISTLLSRVYKTEGKVKLLDSGFNIFYVGINLGAFICNFVAAITRNSWGWHAAFGTAGIGMLIGLIIFLFVYKKLGRADITKEERKQLEGNEGSKDGGMQDLLKITPFVFILGAMGALAWGITGAFFMASIPIIFFYIRLWLKARAEEKGPLGALLAVSALLIPFWMVFQLYGTVMTFWADEYTDRQISWKPVMEVLDAVYLLQDAPPSYFANADPTVPRPHKDWLEVVLTSKSEAAQMTDEQKKEAAEKDGAIRKAYAKRLRETDYLRAGPVPVTQEEFNSVYEKADPQTPTMAVGQSLKVINAELFQSVNPFLIMLLNPAILAIWGFLRKRKKEPSTPVKIAIGIMFGALYMYVMVLAVKYGDDGVYKMSAFVLIGAYLVVTIGELWLSPVSLSLFTKMSPARFCAAMLGCYFLSSAIGNKLSGIIAEMWATADHKSFFTTLAIVMAIFSVVVYAISPWLKKYMPEKKPADEAPPATEAS